MANEELPSEIELNFEKNKLHELYQHLSNEIHPERWERIRQEIRFEDVVADLTGNHGTSIRCPFHGSDSRPSFWLYKGSNDGWCFGCPPKEQYYDHIRFVSRYLDMSRGAALRWLEKKWELPELLIEEEEEADTVTIQLEFEDLQEPYLLKAIRQVQAFKDVELAEDFIRYYFEAVQQLKWAEQAKKEGEVEDSVSMTNKAATILARVIGKGGIERILVRKSKQKQVLDLYENSTRRD